MAAAIKVRIKAELESLATRVNFLKICANFKIKIEKIIPINIDFLIFCSEIHDAEKIFDSEVTAGLSACTFTLLIPPEIKANRSIILRRVDRLICDSSTQVIKSEIETYNDWAKVPEVVKFPNSNTMKLVFMKSDFVQVCLNRGINMFHMHVPASQISKEIYITVPTCYRGFAIDEHLASSCPRNPG